MTFVCIILPDGYAFYEVTSQAGGWLLPRSHLIATANGLPYKPHRVAVQRQICPEDLIRRYAQRRGLVDVNLQVLNPLDL